MIGRLQEWLRRHVALVVGVLICSAFAVLAYGIVVARENSQKTRRIAVHTRQLAVQTARVAEQNRRAFITLCALRADFDQRIVGQTRSIRQGYIFLHKNPHGFDGFTPAVIKSSIRAQVLQRDNTVRSRRVFKILGKCAKKGKHETARSLPHGAGSLGAFFQRLRR